jgi:hypothetical protein
MNKPTTAGMGADANQVDSACRLMGDVASLMLSLKELLLADDDGGEPLLIAVRTTCEKAGWLSERAQSALGRKPSLCGGDYAEWCGEASRERELAKEGGDHAE